MKKKITVTNADPNTVIHVPYSNVYIKNGCVVMDIYDKKGNCVGFREYAPEITLQASDVDIDTWEVDLDVSFNTAVGNNYNLSLLRKDLSETGILILGNYGYQIEKNSANIIIKSIINQEVNAPVNYHYSKIGWDKVNGKLIFKGYHCIGMKATYRGDLAIRPKGKFDTWKNMINKSVLGNERLEAALAFGFSSVLLEFLKQKRDVENILISMCGESTTGKSTAAYLAVSSGCYPGFDVDSLALTFLSTENALINSLTNNMGYPVMIDEASLSKSKNFTTFLYTVSQGKEKARLNKDCTKKEPGVFSQTIVITTEVPLLNGLEQNTGLFLRCLEFYGVPWTNDAESAEEIMSVIHNNYGHAIPKIAKYLINKIEDGTDNQIFEMYDYWRSRFVDKAKEDGKMNTFIDRVSKKLSVIMVGAEVAKDALNIDFNLEKIFEFIDQHNHVKEIEKMDIGNRAYEHFVQTVYANNNKFRRPSVKKGNMPDFVPTEFWGVIENIETVSIKSGGFASKQIKIAQKYFDKIIYEGGFNDPKIVLGKLRDAGLLYSEKDRLVSYFDITGNGDSVPGYIIRTRDIEETKDQEKEKKKELAIPKRKQLSEMVLKNITAEGDEENE